MRAGCLGPPDSVAKPWELQGAIKQGRQGFLQRWLCVSGAEEEVPTVTGKYFFILQTSNRTCFWPRGLAAGG